MYFRFLESMGLPWISLRRKKFQRSRGRFAIFTHSAINNRITMKSPDVYLLSEVSIKYYSYDQSERRKSRLQVDHLYISRTFDAVTRKK